ncbi:MAG: hypothetical protein ACRENP_02530 [Longimicrobiales bacterium]
MTSQNPGPAHERVALSQELSEFLIEFSIALHRTSMYPRGHPTLERSATIVVSRLAALLLDRPSISIGVARKQLVIEGVATDPRHPVLRSLAEKLHRHQLGAISFERGASTDEIVNMMRVVAVEPEKGALPLGLGDPEALTQWQFVRLFPLTYEQLQLIKKEGEGDDDESGDEREIATRTARLWIGLARAALAADDPDLAPEKTEPAVVANAINQHPAAKAYDQVIVGYLLQLAQELKQDGGVASGAVRKRLSRLIGELDDPTLQRLIEMGGDLMQRRKFVLDATEALAADAVVEIVQAAAASNNQTISNSMLRLLTKLSAFAEEGPHLVQIQADNALREQVQHMVETWTLEDPNPDAYTRALVSLARRGLSLASTAKTSYQPEPLRLVQMALEVDSVGIPLWRAVAQVVEQGGITALVDLLVRTSAESNAARAVWRHLTTIDQTSQLLNRDNVDFSALNLIFDRMDAAALAPLLMHVLKESESRSTRLGVFKRLASMELPVVEPLVVRGLADERWFVRRNMLALLNEMDAYSEAVAPAPLARQGDPRIRREALQLWMRSPHERERAICVALADLDERALRAAVAEAQKGVPEAAIPLIARRALEHLPTDLRSQLLRLLRGQRHPQACDALLRFASAGRTLLGRYKLAPRSTESLIALNVLAETWPADARVAALLARARKADDPEIRAAANAPVYAG